MLKNVKYLWSLLSSYIFCAVAGFIVSGFDLPSHLYLLFFMPIAGFILYLVLNKKSFSELIKYFVYLITGICFILMWASDHFREYMNINEYSLTALVFLGLNITYALFLPKTSPNNTAGIRTALTLAYPKVWEKTHKILPVFVLWTVFPLILLIFYTNGKWKMLFATFLVFLPLFLAAIYSEFIGRKIEKSEEEADRKHRQQQIRQEEQDFKIQKSKAN